MPFVGQAEAQDAAEAKGEGNAGARERLAPGRREHPRVHRKSGAVVQAAIALSYTGTRSRVAPFVSATYCRGAEVERSLVACLYLEAWFIYLRECVAWLIATRAPSCT